MLDLHLGVEFALKLQGSLGLLFGIQVLGALDESSDCGRIQ